MCRSPQITRAQYQNGLLASRLDSTPQSPEGSHARLDTSVSLPPVTPPGTRAPLPLATPPAKRQRSNTQPAAPPPAPSSRAALPQTTSTSSRRPSQSLPQATPLTSNHAPLSSTSMAFCSLNPRPTQASSKAQPPPPPSASPENGPGETTTLLSEQQNCVGPRRPSHAQAHPHAHVHTISHAHTESTI